MLDEMECRRVCYFVGISFQKVSKISAGTHKTDSWEHETYFSPSVRFGKAF